MRNIIETPYCDASLPERPLSRGKSDTSSVLVIWKVMPTERTLITSWRIGGNDFLLVEGARRHFIHFIYRALLAFVLQFRMISLALEIVRPGVDASDHEW